MNKIINSNRFKILRNFFVRKIPNLINDFFLVILFFLLDVNFKGKDFVIVSASDYTHYESSLNLFKSLTKYEKNAKLVFYDLGLKDFQKKEFKQNFKDVEYIDFNYSLYPKFLSERDSDNKLGWYGWKPLIIKECIDKYGKNTLWLDSGCIITKRLNLIRKCLNVKGIYVASSVGKIHEWTHQKSIRALKLPKKYLNKSNYAGGLVGFNPDKKNSINLLNEWINFAMNKEALFPEGSSRKNHRHDQSILTMLIYKNKSNFFSTRTHSIFGIEIHNDPNKIYIWPNSSGHFINSLNKCELDNFTNTYKNASFIIFTNLIEIRKIKAKCNKKQKIIYVSNEKLLSQNKDKLKKLIEKGSIYKYIEDNKYLDPLDLIFK